MRNGQIGLGNGGLDTWQVTRFDQDVNCDPVIGGAVNKTNTQSSYGANCDGKTKDSIAKRRFNRFYKRLGF